MHYAQHSYHQALCLVHYDIMTSTQCYDSINISGGEVTFDNKDLTLRASNILITHGGLFQVQQSKK